MSDHEDFEHVSLGDANGRDRTPPRNTLPEAVDATPTADLNALNTSAVLSSPPIESPHVTGVSEIPAASAPAVAPLPPFPGLVDDSTPAVPAAPATTDPFTKIPAQTRRDAPAVAPALPPSPPLTTSTCPPSGECGACECCDVTRAYPYLNWEDPIKTGLLFLAGLATFFVFGVLRVRLFSFAAHAFMFTAVAAGAIKAAQAHGINVGSLSFERCLKQHKACLDAAPARVAACVERSVACGLKLAVDVLSWKTPIRSLKALAIVWLASHACCCCFGKVPMFLAFVAAFTFPWAHTHYKAKIDNTFRVNVKPHLIKAADFATKTIQQTTMMNGALVAVLGGVLWIVFFPLTSWLTTVSTVFLIMHALPHCKPKTA